MKRKKSVEISFFLKMFFFAKIIHLICNFYLFLQLNNIHKTSYDRRKNGHTLAKNALS
jgi:hypothetical protein